MLEIVKKEIKNKMENVIMPYKSMVCPHLEYCVQFKFPAPLSPPQKYMVKVKKAQRRERKIFREMEMLPYEERLYMYNLSSQRKDA